MTDPARVPAMTGATSQVLVVDVGTSSVRAGLVAPDGDVRDVVQVALASSSPAPGLVELDAAALARAVLETASGVLERAGGVAGVGITNQRATTVVWDRTTGEPVGPGIGWQDLRTVLDCLTLQQAGLRLAPNQSATKLRWLVANAGLPAERLAFGTVDAWVAHTLSGGALHVTDATNAGVTGLVDDAGNYDAAVLDALGVEGVALPRIVDTCGIAGEASALRGSPPIAAIVGDQQGSLAGQGCTEPGQGKLTVGTGGMLDLVTGTRAPFARRGDHGCFPIVARRRGGRDVFGIEAILLTAGACVAWLRDELGLVADATATGPLAASVPDTAGVAFVPALLGVGTPDWDFGARGAFFGLTRGATGAHLVRAVLEGIAQRCAELLTAAEGDAGVSLASLRVDGGMTDNDAFVQLLADATGRPVEVAPVREATTRGAGLLAHLALGSLPDEATLQGTWRPRRVVEPGWSDERRAVSREAWLAAKRQALRTVPGLSEVAF